MELFYNIVHIIHLFSAMLFLGWGFAKLFVLSAAKNNIDANAHFEMKKSLAKRVWKIYPTNFFILIITGSILFFKYANFENGLFPTTFQTLLIIKAVLAVGIGAKVLYSVSGRILFKIQHSQDPNPVETSAYKYIFSIAVIIVLLAKLMFMVR